MSVFIQRPTSDAEWAEIKAFEHAKVALRKYDLGRLTIELGACAQRRGRLVCQYRAWRDGIPLGFGPDGTAEIERHGIGNPPIFVPDPLGSYAIVFVDPRTGKRRTDTFREDLPAALIETIAHAIRVHPRPTGRVIPGKTARTTETEFPGPGTTPAPIDGMLNRASVDESFSSIRGGAGNSENISGASGALQLEASATTDQYDVLNRMAMGFDTSALGSDTLDDATLSVRTNAISGGTGLDDVGMGITQFTPTVETGWAASNEYAVANYGSTDFATRINVSALTDKDYSDFPLNASGLASFNSSGNSYFAFRVGWDIDNSFGGTWSSGARSGIGVTFADFGGTSRDPQLVYNHTAAGGTIPPLAYHHRQQMFNA